MPTVQEALQELKAALVGLYGTRLVGVFLYGSHARGTAEEGSDIDVLVVLRGPVQAGDEVTRMGPLVSRISLARDLLVSVYPVSDERYAEPASAFLQAVRREAVPA